MPLTTIQRLAIDILRPFRKEHDFVAGGAVLNRNWPRLSDDMDIFHDLRNRLPRSVEAELNALRQAGFSVELTTEDEWTVEAVLRWRGEETRVQWFDDAETCRRFFPAQDDPDFGFRLHDADVAVNKVLCAARRRSAARDAVDLGSIVERYAPLGPLAWAACGKAPDLNPTVVLRDIRANAFGYAREEIETVRMADGAALSWDHLREFLDRALDVAADYCDDTAPADHPGCLFVNAEDLPVAAGPADLESGLARPLTIRDFSALPVISTP